MGLYSSYRSRDFTLGELPPWSQQYWFPVEGHREKGAICEQPGTGGSVHAKIKPGQTPDQSSATPAWLQGLSKSEGSDLPLSFQRDAS